jgi:TonB family protein
MNDEYLWDKSGPVQPDVRELESALSVLGFRADAFIPEALLAKLAPPSLSAPTFSSLETPPLAVRLAHLARMVVADFRRGPKDFVTGLLFDDAAAAAGGPLWRRLHAQVEYNSAAFSSDPRGYLQAVTAATKRDRQRRRTLGWSFLFSFFLFTTTLVGVCAIPLFAPPPDLAAQEDDHVQVISMLNPLPPPPEPKPANHAGLGANAPGGGGGGGGKSDPAPATKGRSPEATLNDFERIVDPTTKPPKIEAPSLPVSPKIKGNPDLVRPDLTQPIGVPNGANGPPSDGKGDGRGIGDGGKGDGVGNGDGPGAGRGKDGGVGGGAGGGSGGDAGGAFGGGGTLRPKVFFQVKPRYTEEGRANKIQGKVVLSVEFRADGTIGNVAVVRSLGYGLDENAIAAARQIRFTPAMVNGVPKTIVTRVEYTFSLL